MLNKRRDNRGRDNLRREGRVYACTCVRERVVYLVVCVRSVCTSVRGKEKGKPEREGKREKEEGRVINAGSSSNPVCRSFNPCFPTVLRSALFLSSFLDQYIYIYVHINTYICTG